MTVPALPVAPSLAARLAGTPLLLLLDVDGTISPIAPRPEYAVTPAETKRVLCELVALDGVHIVLVSGRSAEDARRVVDVPGLWVIGNHGLEIAQPDAAPEPSAHVADFEGAIAGASKRADELAGEYSGVIVENKRWTLSVHYRLAHPRIVPRLTEQVGAIAVQFGLRLTRGREVLELRPPIDVDKGVAALALARSLGALGSDGSVLCAGDDSTDEDAFRALRAAQERSVTVRVGAESTSADTAAEFSVVDTSAMRELLDWVLRSRTAGSTSR